MSSEWIAVVVIDVLHQLLPLPLPLSLLLLLLLDLWKWYAASLTLVSFRLAHSTRDGCRRAHQRSIAAVTSLLQPLLLLLLHRRYRQSPSVAVVVAEPKLHDRTDTYRRQGTWRGSSEGEKAERRRPGITVGARGTVQENNPSK